jgi:spore maturation protein CgeB
MSPQLNIAFFGSSLVSAYWNGAATYYRGIVRALAKRGHHITFYEPDAYDRQQHRDIADPEWARVVVYPARNASDVLAALDGIGTVDVLVKASGVGVFDRLLEEAVLERKSRETAVVFWDVDAPATLDRVHSDAADYFAALIPRCDFIFTYGGGGPVVGAYNELGARLCVPVYNALDPATHYHVPPDERFAGDLAFLGNRMPDREARVEEFFFTAARLSSGRFILGGNGWQTKPLPRNVHYTGHVYTRDHNAFNCTPKAVLNISRDSMARYGFSPATRVFEAAGAKACILTDAWPGIDLFLEAETEVLVCGNGEEVADRVRALTPKCARAIGEKAYRRILACHTYAHRAELVEALLTGKAAALVAGRNAVPMAFS